MSRAATNNYSIIGLKPNTPASVIQAARENWLEYVKPILLDDAKRVVGSAQRWDRQRKIETIDNAYFELLTKNERRRRAH